MGTMQIRMDALPCAKALPNQRSSNLQRSIYKRNRLHISTINDAMTDPKPLASTTALSSTDEHEGRTSSTVLSELKCVDGYDDDVDDEKPMTTPKVKRAPLSLLMRRKISTPLSTNTK
jgi:hypothetical protein